MNFVVENDGDEDFAEVKVEHQVTLPIIEPYLCPPRGSAFTFSLSEESFIGICVLVISLWFLGDILGAHQSNKSMSLLCIWKQYCQCFSGWNCQVPFLGVVMKCYFNGKMEWFSCKF